MAAYPRKQTVVIFAICAIAVSGVAYYAYGGSLDKISAQNNDAHPSATLSVSNGSPAVDWQAQFVDANTQSGDFQAKAKPSAAKTETLTPTDKLGRNFLNQYALLREAGLTGDQQTVDDVMSQVASQSLSVGPSPKSYTLVDIKTVPNNSQSISAYNSAIDAVFKTYASQKDEADIAAQAFETGNMSLLQDIDPIIYAYKNLVGKLAATPVPQAFVAYHLDLINGMSAALSSAQSFRHVDTDALQALAAVQLNALGTQGVIIAFSNIQRSLTDAKVAGRF